MAAATPEAAGVGTAASSTAAPQAAPQAGTEPPRDGAPPPAKVLAAHFAAEFYEVTAAAERLSALNGRSLAERAGSADGLLKALGDFGAAKILYRFDQPVNVLDESLRFGTNEPYVMGSRTTPNGQMINSVSYRQVGAIVRLSADMPAAAANRKEPAVKLSVELSIPTSSKVEIMKGQTAPSLRNVSIEHTEELAFGQPRVFLSVSQASAEEQQSPAVYVIRYVFSR